MPPKSKPYLPKDDTSGIIAGNFDHDETASPWTLILVMLLTIIATTITVLWRILA